MKRFNKVLYKLIISYIVIITLTGGIIGGVSNYYFSKNYEKQVASLHENIFLSLRNDLQTKIFDRVDRIYSSLWFMGIFSANLFYVEDGTDKVNLSLVHEIHDYMKKDIYLLNNDTVSAVHLYFMEDDIVISSLLGLKFIGDATNAADKELFWIREADSRRISYEWLAPEENGEAVFTYVRSYPNVPEINANVLMAVDYDEKTIEKTINKASPDDYGSVFLIDETGMIISHTDKTLLYTKVDFNNKFDGFNGNGFGSFITDGDSGKSMVLFCNAGINNWRLAAVIPLTSYYEAVDKTGNLIAAISIIAILTGIFLSFVFSSSFYNPIRAIAAAIKRFDNSAAGDEHAIIKNAVQNMVDKFTEMEATLETNAPVMKSKFINNLIYELISDKKKLSEQMALLKMNVDEKHFFCIVIRLSQPEFNSAPIEQRQYMKLKIIEAVETFKTEIRIIGTIDIGENRIVIVCGTNKDNVPADTETEILCEMIAEYAFRQFGLRPGIFIGSTYNEFLHVGKSYKEAVLIRKYDYFYPDRIFLRSTEFIKREPDENEAGRKSIPTDMLKDFTEALNLRKLNSVSSTLRMISDELRGDSYSAADCHAYLLEIVHRLSVYIKNVQYTPSTEQKSDLYSGFNSTFDIFSLEKWILSYCEEIFIFLESKENSRCSDLVLQMKDYIDKNLADDISLDTLADKLELSPKYISRLFKDETGENFVEYLTRRRMEAAAQLLSGTDLSVEETALAVGYKTSAYFIKKFKSIYGETPNNYRKQHK